MEDKQLEREERGRASVRVSNLSHVCPSMTRCLLSVVKNLDRAVFKACIGLSHFSSASLLKNTGLCFCFSAVEVVRDLEHWKCRQTDPETFENNKTNIIQSSPLCLSAVFANRNYSKELVAAAGLTPLK